MKIHLKLIGILAGAMFMLGTGMSAQAQNQNTSTDPGNFRNQLLNWALTSQPSGELAGKINELSDIQIKAWISVIEDPNEFLRSMEQATIRLQSPELLKTMPLNEGNTQLMPGPVVQTAPSPSTTPFPPDYPPSSGAYKDVIIDAISGFGIGGASSTNRCSASDWGDFIGVWWPLNKGIDALDGACVVAGCDPIGLVCLGACGILEAAKIALKVAAVPLEACDVHQGAIDGAEIEATFENTKGLGNEHTHIHDDLQTHEGNLTAHDTDLKALVSTHDTDLKAALSTHDTDLKAVVSTHDADLKVLVSTHDSEIKALLANIQAGVNANSDKLDILMARQLETIRLLHTPQGRRDSNVPACSGDSCDWPER